VATDVEQSFCINPPKPDLEVSPVSCEGLPASISITVQRSGDQYSFDNGNTFQNMNMKAGVEPGNYKILVRTADGCVSAAEEITIVAPVVPEQPIVTGTSSPTGFVLLESTKADEYTWMKGGVAIPGATSSTYKAESDGTYTVVVTSADGCKSEPSDLYTVVITGDIASNNSVVLYPNPAGTHIYYKTDDPTADGSIYSIDGKKTTIVPVLTGDSLVFNVEHLTPGTYVLRISDHGKVSSISWIKM